MEVKYLRIPQPNRNLTRYFIYCTKEADSVDVPSGQDVIEFLKQRLDVDDVSLKHATQREICELLIADRKAENKE